MSELMDRVLREKWGDYPEFSVGDRLRILPQKHLRSELHNVKVTVVDAPPSFNGLYVVVKTDEDKEYFLHKTELEKVSQ